MPHDSYYPYINAFLDLTREASIALDAYQCRNSQLANAQSVRDCRMLSPKCNRNSVSPPPKALGSPWERNQEEIPGEVVEEGILFCTCQGSCTC